MIKQRKNTGKFGDKKEKATQEKIIQLEEINPIVLRKEGRLKTCRQPDAREAEQCWSKIWQPREHNKKKKAEIHIDLLRMIMKKDIKLEFAKP